MQARKCRLQCTALVLSRRCCLRHAVTKFSGNVFSCACSLIRPHCSGCPFPSPHLKALGSATQGQARDRDSRAALGNPQDKRHLRQTYSGRSARVATRPESQAAPPHNSIFRDDCHLPAMVRLTGGYARWILICICGDERIFTSLARSTNSSLTDVLWLTHATVGVCCA